ncbi:MAG: hypothetical protein LC620_05435, partial [Halobacteriales archaeon]|nr:hypothetical protein [Halobacteriales archaeon]
PVDPLVLSPVNPLGAATTIWFTSYKADGTHRWTTPWPVEPNVDRPWVRAGAENQVFIGFNTGSATDFYASTDGGRTWDGNVIPPHQFPCPLGNLGQGGNRSELYVVAPCVSGNAIDSLKLWTSHDSGKTWDEGEKVPMPDLPFKKSDGPGLELMNPPVGDAAGNLYVPFTHALDAKNQQSAVFVARRATDGTWTQTQVSTAGLVHLPWGAAANTGQAAFAWYQSDGTADNETKAAWRLMSAASVDADGATPHYQTTVADPAVLWNGTFGRSLGDFIESDFTPDGRFVVVYAHRAPPTSVAGQAMSGKLTIRFVSSDGMLDLAPLKFLNGPHPVK